MNILQVKRLQNQQILRQLSQCHLMTLDYQANIAIEVLQLTDKQMPGRELHMIEKWACNINKDILRECDCQKLMIGDLSK